MTRELLCLRPRRIYRQKFPKRTRILFIPIKPHSFHSVHSAIGSRMNGMIFRSFRKRNSSQKNANTVYSEHSYSGIVPKECVPVVNMKVSILCDKTERYYGKNEIKRHGRRISHVFLLFRHVETRYCSVVAS